MSFKIVDTKRKVTFTQRDEEILMEAFKRFAPRDDVSVVAGRRERLNSYHKPGWSCSHRWSPVTKNTDNMKFFSELYEEDELGDSQKYCEHCGATSLWENGTLWAYDATVRFYNRPPKKIRKQF